MTESTGTRRRPLKGPAGSGEGGGEGVGVGSEHLQELYQKGWSAGGSGGVLSEACSHQGRPGLHGCPRGEERPEASGSSRDDTSLPGTSDGFKQEVPRLSAPVAQAPPPPRPATLGGMVSHQLQTGSPQGLRAEGPGQVSTCLCWALMLSSDLSKHLGCSSQTPAPR